MNYPRLSRQGRWPIETAALVYFDLETTGLRPDRGARITEMAVIERERVRFDWRREQVPDPVVLPLPALFEHLRAGVVVGHNLQFDFRFVAYEADRRGLRGPAVRFIDTLALARNVMGRTSDVRLSTLVHYFGITLDGELHTARTDARAAQALFWELVARGELETLADAGLKRLDWGVF